ncbi:SPOR domain-containing protein [Pseudofulvimonas gallinarii]|uniref:Cell division septation protein DedD n=1 Tax=Pseudofulvimonas gallinarii TaxID=634155 RepID=A0A4V2UVW4_9GAMM|nr:SPOR domain-containing protein [Pseudofulvimonas gallinarii]TCS97397.1 cell division septation protein DedD [Pseudofulvimonas gallinarii]THD13226.1 hypothetical protein B1808_09420 [Pseudofulvimonas gallinarii]
MEQTLKKRLIGASILIIAAAIFLPMFLAGPPPGQQAGQTLSLDLPPPPDRDMSEVRLPLGTSAGDSVDPSAIVAVEVPPRGQVDAAPEEDVQPAPTPAPASAPRPASPAATAPATAASTPAPASAPARQQAPAASAGGRFWVGLGSYGQAANADRVVNAARGRGIDVARDTVTREGRELIRLRAGPWSTRAQAEQARQLLIAAVPDARPTIEESDSTPTADAPATAVSGAGAWAVQVGAFSTQANANQLSERLRGAGYPAFVERRGESWAVRVGPYVRRTEAEAQKQKLKSSQRLDGMIVAHSG